MARSHFRFDPERPYIMHDPDKMKHFMFPGREILHMLSFISVQLAFLRHADRVKIGCMTGGLGALCASDHDNVWKTASHYAYMQMLKYAKGTSMRTAVESDTYDMPGYAIDDTSQYTGKEGVNYIDSASAWDKENNTLTVFAINRNENESYGLNVDIKGFEGYTNVEHFEMFCTDDELDKVSSVDNQEMFLPKKNTTGELKDGVYSVSVNPLSWNVFVFKK
jgi:alpha-N-arabinofuranosidase